jgi:predicted ribosomally synthesized peptide with SipW-like signal peptide
MKWFRRISPKLLLACASAAILTVAAVGTTLAYFTAKTDAQQNQFTPGVVDIAVVEPNGSNLTIDSSHSADQVVSITNVQHDSSVPVYVRAKLIPIVRWADESKGGSGDPVTVLADGVTPPESGISVSYTIDTAGWTALQSDGFYYYKKVLKPGANTSKLLNGVKVYGLPSDKKLEIQVIADSIQTVAGAEKSAWGKSFNKGSWS